MTERKTGKEKKGEKVVGQKFAIKDIGRRRSTG
jgi:hypothetical protein